MLTPEQEKKRQLLIDYNMQLELCEVKISALKTLINIAEHENQRHLIIDYNLQLQLYNVQASSLRNLIAAAQRSCDHMYDAQMTPYCDIKICRIFNHHEFIE